MGARRAPGLRVPGVQGRPRALSAVGTADLWFADRPRSSGGICCSRLSACTSWAPLWSSAGGRGASSVSSPWPSSSGTLPSSPSRPSSPTRRRAAFTRGSSSGLGPRSTAIAIAWSREYANSTVNLFFVLPIKGKVLLWATLGFCVLDLIYPTPLHEGVVALRRSDHRVAVRGLALPGTDGLAPPPTRRPAATRLGRPRRGRPGAQTQAPRSSRIAAASGHVRGPRGGAEEAHAAEGQAVPELR